MSKRKNDFTSPAEDYIEQLNWRAKHPNLRGGYSNPLNMPHGRITSLVILIFVVGAGTYLIFSSEIEIGIKIFSIIIFSIILLIFFFAGRDASKNHDNSSKHLD